MKKTKGWFREPRRHSLASKGIKTKKKPDLYGPSIKRYQKPHISKEPSINFTPTTDMPIFDASIKNPNGPNRTYEVDLVQVTPDEYIEIQKGIFAKYNDKYYTPDQLFWGGISKNRVNQIKEELKTGKPTPSFVVEFDKNGNLLPYQEGRHRIVAMKEMGVKTVPVWVAKRRF